MTTTTTTATIEQSLEATLTIGGRAISLGRFATIDDARLRLQLAQSLCVLRKARGERLTLAELHGEPADGPDLLAAVG